MEVLEDVIIKVPPPMEDMFKAFMRAAGVATISDFTRKAVNHALRQQDQPPLPRDMCEVYDDLQTKRTGEAITIGLIFKGEAAVLSSNMELETDGDSWVTDSLYDYMKALTPVLPRDDLKRIFSSGLGCDPGSQVYPH